MPHYAFHVLINPSNTIEIKTRILHCLVAVRFSPASSMRCSRIIPEWEKILPFFDYVVLLSRGVVYLNISWEKLGKIERT